MSNPDDKPPEQKTAKPTAQFVADEIKEATQQGADIADKGADRLERSYEKQLEAEKFSKKVWAGMFALSLLVNLALGAGLLKQYLTVTESGVSITQTSSTTTKTTGEPTKVPETPKAVEPAKESTP